VQRGSWNVFDSLHHLDEFVMKVWSDWRKTDTAISHGRGGHTVM
jgi:hypothetical protein